jgi:hypothetical protein
MIPTETSPARRVAYRLVTAGWATALGMLLARATTVALQLRLATVDQR